MKRLSVRNFVLLALLVAIQIVLGYVNIPMPGGLHIVFNMIPMAIAACHQVGGDPRGLLILIEAGALTAFMTPMPTAAVPYMMAYGGYRQQDLVKGGWLYAVISCILSVGWVMTVMPVLP